MPALIKNKKARLRYAVEKTYEAGIELFGFEVKSLKNQQGSLDGAYAVIRGGEAYVLNMHIPPYQPANTPESYDPYRTRRLLLTRQEIDSLAGYEKQSGLTLVPLSVYTKGQRLKLEIAVARGKKKYDKREAIKKRDVERDIGNYIKNR